MELHLRNINFDRRSSVSNGNWLRMVFGMATSSSLKYQYKYFSLIQVQVHVLHLQLQVPVHENQYLSIDEVFSVFFQKGLLFQTHYMVLFVARWRHNFREIAVKNCEKSKNQRRCLCAPLRIDSWEIWRWYGIGILEFNVPLRVISETGRFEENSTAIG